jgi:hypothetical protein
LYLQKLPNLKAELNMKQHRPQECVIDGSACCIVLTACVVRFGGVGVLLRHDVPRLKEEAAPTMSGKAMLHLLRSRLAFNRETASQAADAGAMQFDADGAEASAAPGPISNILKMWKTNDLVGQNRARRKLAAVCSLQSLKTTALMFEFRLSPPATVRLHLSHRLSKKRGDAVTCGITIACSHAFCSGALQEAKTRAEMEREDRCMRRCVLSAAQRASDELLSGRTGR